ncbi:TetR/AcrR family transcriptional regulator [Corynebacterium senegalense]|mgnify:CR=1 FL=1|uniref:TetR/AcrR family transcriptional regulator n=1 Tax=Corynebacterium senegalense TaxID=2080750 RepID=UPI001FE4E2FA|nr:TetR/AcrR family transcriptional regulator [Corynebacterium senegalense]
MADTIPSAPEAEAAAASALEVFARHGYEATKLQTLADATGMSKRMIHYHFGDKRGLYRACLTRAIHLLTPPQEVLNRSYAVPVEGMRRFVDAIFHRFLHNPGAVRLVLRENLDPVLAEGDTLKPHELSEVLLHLERILLLGQDSGAFRPEVSADDILIMLCSLCLFREGNHRTAHNLTQVDLRSQRNVEGMRRMAIDTVLAFLTSNIPPSGYGSYLEAEAAPEQEEGYEVDGAIY